MKNKISTQLYSSPCGDLILGSYENSICICDWLYRTRRTAIDNRIKEGLQAEFVQEKSSTIEYAIKELNEYFFEKRTVFTLPLIMIGSSFQKNVWKELLTIPHGNTITYYQLSQKIKNTKAIRAVSSANGANSISIFIPCHRVIGSSGELTGYAGGLTCKQQLLELESTALQTKLF
jgi:methylated-DNA-[protein]-cysteine S-methyltransferase